MKIKFYTTHDLLYISFASSKIRAFKTISVQPGVFADFGRDGKVIGIEILDASSILGDDRVVSFILEPKRLIKRKETAIYARDKRTTRYRIRNK
jgi:uncharacterized protein YuzE